MTRSRNRSKAMALATADLPLIKYFQERNQGSLINSAQAKKQGTKTTWEEFAAKTMIRSGRELIPFIPYSYQTEFIRQIEAHYGTVAVKSRQMGFTEMVASYFLWSAFLNPAYLAVIFSKTQQDTTNIARRVRTMTMTHPDVCLETENLQDLKLINGGRLLFKPATPNAARGLESVAAILFDEAAFVPGIEEIYSAAMPSTEMLGDEARIIILSTPNGQSGFYWDRVSEENGDFNILEVCEKVRTGQINPIQYWTDDQGWCKFLAHWKSHPIYSQRGNYLETLAVQKRMPQAKIRQEYDLDFTAASESLFNQEAVRRQAIGQWCEPVSGHKYLIGVDPNFGGSDYFRVQVWDISSTPASLVAKYGEKQRAIEYSKTQLLNLIDRYKPIMTAIESNSGGAVILEQLIKERRGVRFEGINTSRVSKRLNTDRIAIAVEQGEVIYPPDWAGIQEMSVFSSINREASSGHDDEVMAFAVAFACYDEALKLSGKQYGEARAYW